MNALTMSSESSLSSTPVAAPGTPSLADLLSVRPQQDARASATATQAAAAYREDSADIVVPMPFLRQQTEHFSSLGSTLPGGSVDTQADAPLAAPVAANTGNTPKARVPLVLLHGNSSEGALAQTWMHRVLEGEQLFGMRFQDNFAEPIQRQQPQAILVQFIPGATDTAVQLAGQLQQLFPHIPRIAIGHSKSPECMLAALRAGVQDFLDMDGPLDTAQQTVRHLLSQPMVTEPLHQRAPVTALLSARAGLGCSLAASHLAWYLQQRLGPSLAGTGAALDDETAHLACLLIEMGTPGSDCSIYLNTPGEFSFNDAVSQQRRLDKRMAQSALARHDSGLRLLAQSRQARPVASDDADALLGRLGQYFDHIVLDLGAASPQLALQVLPSASDIWVLCDQSVASVVWTAELLAQLDAHQIERERMQLIVCRHDARLELSAQQMARQLQLPLLGVIPERRRELAQVVNLGALLPLQPKREPYVQALQTLMQNLLEQHHPDLAEQTHNAVGPLAHLLQRFRKH